MGFISFVLGLLVLREMFYFILLIAKSPTASELLSTKTTITLLLGAVFLFCYGYWNAKRGPRIVTVSIPVVDLPEELQGFSIIQLSDLHLGPGVNTKFVENVVNLTLSLDANILVMTGDMVDGSFHDYKDSANSLSRLTHKFPVLYVTGNHEYYKDGQLWVDYFSELGMKPLLNEHTAIPCNGKTVLFAGVTDPAEKIVRANSKPSISKALKNAPTADIKILLAHQPNIATEAAPYFHLQLSGHTHGGQFFPWIFMIGFFQKFPRGLMKSGAMWVYVNVGTGFWGPSLRVGTHSEISLLRLVKAERP
jgi:predicted MPP superfamily phosphohydrolase